MSLTRIGSIGINTGIKFSGLTTITTLNTSIDTLSIGGPVSIAGTLTYEDVTNIDSVGLVTARNGIVVGSGITLSKDGDIFATGVTTSTTFVGALTGNVTGNISGGTVAGSTGTFSSDVSVGGELQIADYIVHTGDGNTAIRFPAADTFSVETSGTQRLRVEAAGNVNFANNVNVSGTSTVTGIAQFANTINLTHASAGQNYIYFNEDLQLAKNGTGTRLKIDSSGRVLIGQTSSINGVYGSPPPRFSVSTTTASPAIFATYSNDVYGSRIDLIKSRATTVGGTTVVQAGDAIGEIVFGGADGDQFHPTAIIQSTVESGVGDNDMPGDLRFYTNGGATTGTERVRIDSSGNLKFNSGFGSVQTAYGVRAWVFINNTTGSMTPYTDGSGGVSSVEDLGAGAGRVNFSITMPNTAYAIVSGHRREGTYDMTNVGFSNATTSFRFDSFTNGGNSNADLQAYSFVIVR